MTLKTVVNMFRPMPDAQRLIFDPQHQTFRFSASCRPEYAGPVRAGYVGSLPRFSDVLALSALQMQ